MALRLNGSTSGYVGIDAPATAANNTLVLPNGNGSNGQALTTNGSGTLSWTSITSSQWTTSGSDINYTAGKVLVGTSTARSNLYNSTLSALAQFEDTASPRIAVISSSNVNGRGGAIVLAHQVSDTVGGNTVVSNGDQIGSIEFQGSDGTEFVQAANISAFVDGTPGANDMPGRLVFSTTADGASSPTERMRISNTGATQLTSDQNVRGLTIRNTDSSVTNAQLFIDTVKAANFNFHYCNFQSGNQADTEFVLRGDGNAYADGSWSGGGADYAEYFEWSDSNLDEEDRRGISVVLEGDKIREAVAGEDPIGVISGNPSVVGDAAWNKWSGKYLRDEFGSYLLDENGDRKLNPAYDPDVEYISREQRPEWDCVGLMGKLRIRKGQVTGSRWIKMRDISDSVEEWLVR